MTTHHVDTIAEMVAVKAAPGDTVLLTNPTPGYSSRDGISLAQPGVTYDLGGARVLNKKSATLASCGSGFLLRAPEITLGNGHLEHFNEGAVCILSSAPKARVEGMTITDTTVAVRVGDYTVGTGPEQAVLAGIVARAYGKRGISVTGGSYMELIDVDCDPTGAARPEWPFGIALLAGSKAHHVKMLRARTANHGVDRGPDSYPNGDGIVAEKDTHHIEILNSYSLGNFDSGADLKASDVLVKDFIAEQCARSLRVWGERVIVDGLLSLSPGKHAGKIGVCDLWVSKGASEVQAYGVRTESDRAPKVDTDGGPRLVLQPARVEAPEPNPQPTASTVEVPVPAGATVVRLSFS